MTESREAAHTKGPWTVVITDDQIKAGRCEIHAGTEVIARCHSPFPFDTSWDERDANARLMAASPTLLAMLKACRAALVEAEGYHEGGPLVKLIDAAISLASKETT